MDFERCRVYWGSHGCCLPRNHDGDCVCECALDASRDMRAGFLNVGAWPYYGADTRFYGDDVEARGLKSS